MAAVKNQCLPDLHRVNTLRYIGRYNFCSRRLFGRMAFIRAEYVPAMRNKGKLLKDNHSFLYNLSRKREKKTYWICQKKSQLGCKVTAVVLLCCCA